MDKTLLTCHIEDTNIGMGFGRRDTHPGLDDGLLTPIFIHK